jgi:hypothetical protein
MTFPVSGKRSRIWPDPLAWVLTLLRAPVMEGDHHDHGNGLRPQASACRDTHPCAGHGWLLALTGILLAYGYWGWALLTLAGAVANIVLAYRVYRATTR